MLMIGNDIALFRQHASFTLTYITMERCLSLSLFFFLFFLGGGGGGGEVGDLGWLWLFGWFAMDAFNNLNIYLFYFFSLGEDSSKLI